MGETFEVGGIYQNENGIYEVLEISYPKMLVCYDNGREQWVTMDIQARIWERMRFEMELSPIEALDFEDGASSKLFLKRNGFTAIGTIREIFRGGLPQEIPALYRSGLYAITVPDGYEVGFIAPEKTGRNVIGPKPISDLVQQWVEGAAVVYFGIAGDKPKAKNSMGSRRLKDRLNDLRDHGRGFTSDNGPHGGGETVWQLERYEELEVWVVATPDYPVPVDLEYEYLEAFKKENGGRLPFANRKSGTYRIERMMVKTLDDLVNERNRSPIDAGND